MNPELHAEVVSKPMRCALLIPPDNERKLYGIGWLLRSVGDVSERVGSFQLDYTGNVYDKNGNNDSFLVSTDPRATVDEFEALRWEWIRLG